MDIPLLVEHFIGKYNRQFGLTVRNITRLAMDALESYVWPGNVRDLENAVQSAAILARDDIIDIEDLPMRVRVYPEIISGLSAETAELRENITRKAEQMEKSLIVQTLEKHGFNRSRTAGVLGISRKTLFTKMKKYGID